MTPEFELVINGLREPLLLAAPDGRILAANAAAADALATSSTALEGLNLAAYATDAARLVAGLSAADGGAPEPFALLARDGRRFSCDAKRLDATTLLLRLSGGPDAEPRRRALIESLSRLQGITGGDADAHALEETVGADSPSQLGRLHAFTAALAQAMTLAQVCEVVVDLGMAASSARSGGLWLAAESGTEASLARGVGPSGPVAEKFQNVPLAEPGRMPILDAIRTSTPIWLRSCAEADERYPTLRAQFLRPGAGDSSLSCLPLLVQGRCIGGLALNYEGARRFGEDERAFLQLLAWYAAQALERARLHAAERRSREIAEASERRMALLARVGAILGSSLDYQATLTSVAHAAVPSAADWCIVELADDGGPPIPPVAVHVDPSKVENVFELRRRFPKVFGPARGIAGVIQSGKSEFSHDLSQFSLTDVSRDNPEFRQLCRDTGVASSIVVPIRARGRTLGAILLVSGDPARLYDEKDVEMAEELGNRAGVAVDNARLYHEAREANRRKDEFLAMLGHELRNPLAPIQTALELMRLRGEYKFERERGIIDRQVKHVVRLVDDLLDVSRITRGTIEIRKENVELSVIVGKAVEMASPLLEQRSQNLTLAVPPTGLTVLADHGRLSQAISNVLINAAKFTEPRGHISLGAETEGSEITIRVRDSGIGIAPETLPYVFDLFVQHKPSLDRAQGGLGIGLSVVRSLVELHGGSVSAHSAGLGEGSEFVVRLPRASEESDERAAPAAAPDRDEELQQLGLRVLVVDDNPDAALLLADALEVLGHRTQVAGDGPSALAAALSFEPHVALLDIGLPVMDGYELARRFRDRRTPTPIRLVAITGYGQESDRALSRAAGFDAHMVKPVDLDALVAVLAQLADRGPSRPGSAS